MAGGYGKSHKGMKKSTGKKRSTKRSSSKPKKGKSGY